MRRSALFRILILLPNNRCDSGVLPGLVQQRDGLETEGSGRRVLD